MPPAARVGDQHVCPAVTGLVPHVGGPLLPAGAATRTMIGGLPAAVVGTMATCAGGPATVIRGSATVQIEGRPAARVGDQTAHGGAIVPPGCLTVQIGG